MHLKKRKGLMRIAPFFSAVAILIIACALLLGCVPGLQSAKSTKDAERPPATGEPPAPGALKEPQERQTDKSSPSSPVYKPPPPPGQDKTALGSIDLAQKDEVNDAALQFAKNVAGVEHIKTCYSKLYGGWYLFLYLKKAKKISVQQYSWNPKTKEWDIIYHLKELAPERLEYHLKGEVDDEKCFVLK